MVDLLAWRLRAAALAPAKTVDAGHSGVVLKLPARAGAPD
jgi:hypothetical protein